MRAVFVFVVLIFMSMPASGSPPLLATNSCTDTETCQRPEPAIVPAAVAPEAGTVWMPHFVVILAFFAFLLIVATIEIMLRNEPRR